MILILFSDIRWHGLHQRPQHIAAGLAKHWQLLWVQPATLAEGTHFRPRAVAPNIALVSLPTIPYNARNKLIKAIAKLLSYASPLRRFVLFLQFILLRRALKQLGWREESFGFVVNNFQLIPLAKRFDAAFILFDYIDNVFGFTRLPKHVEDQWLETIQSADIITVTSPTLAKQIEPFRAKDVHFVGNGVECALFLDAAETDRPPDLPSGKPIAGYTGAVYPWLDFELLNSVCSTMKNVDFVFIGPIHPDVSSCVQRLSRFENVRFLGFRPYQMMPRYVRHFDVGLIPFQKNELTAAVNPVKLYEYSAAGIPTVATNFSEDISRLHDKVFVSDSKEDFITSLRSAIKKSKDPSFAAQLQAFAREQDWETKTSLILQFIHQHLAGQRVS